MAGEWEKDVQGHIESYIGLQSTTLPKAELICGIVSSVEYNVIQGTAVFLKHRHTLY